MFKHGVYFRCYVHKRHASARLEKQRAQNEFVFFAEMSENKTNFRIKNNRMRQLKSSIISSNQQTSRPSKYIRNKKRLPFNMVVSETAYR